MKEISAGGVVYRRNGGRLQIQLIQDRFGKITLPKGKTEAGETLEQTALREIREETGIRGRIVEPLALIRYQFALPPNDIVDKEVHYYLVEAVGGELAAQEEEIRGVEWLEPAEAWRKQRELGYENNHDVLKKALDKLGVEVEA
jgi:8-oxo-dGTP pyrophosphatase MutT (NUDIX family)